MSQESLEIAVLSIGLKYREVLLDALKEHIVKDPSMAMDVVSLATTEAIKSAVEDVRINRINPLLNAVLFLMQYFVLGRNGLTRAQQESLDRFIIPSLKESPDIANETCTIGKAIVRYLEEKGQRQ